MEVSHTEDKWFEEIKRALFDLNRLALRSIVEELSQRYVPAQILEKYLSPVLESIGEGWHRGELSLSQVYMSGKLCEEVIDELMPEAKGNKNAPKIAVAVLNDFHQLGKKMVVASLQSAGFKVKDYGAGLDAIELVRKVAEDGIEVLFISTLMLPSALNVKHVRELFDELGLKTKLVVGGAPFNFDDELWKEVGADLMGYAASQSISLVNKLSRSL